MRYYIRVMASAALLIIIISGFLTGCASSKDSFMGMEIISDAQADALSSGKEELSSEGDSLLFNGCPAAYDTYENCYYISQRPDTEDFEGKLRPDLGGQIYILEDEAMQNKKDALSTAHVFQAMIVDGNAISRFGIIFTGLSTMCFSSEDKRSGELYGRITVTDTTGGGKELQYPVSSYARMKEKKKKDNIFSHINYSLHLRSDREYSGKNRCSLFGFREDDDWDLDSVMESENAANEMLAIDIWNAISATDGFSAFEIKAAYTLLFLDGRKSGLYLVRVPYDKKSLALKADDELIEWDSLPEGDLSNADADEFMDYSIFIETVYAPKNMAKNKYILRSDIGRGRKCYRLPRHLEYLFNNLPDDLTEYTLNVSDSFDKYIVGDAALKELDIDDLPAAMNGKWQGLRNAVLSDETLIGMYRKEMDYLSKTGYFAKSSVEDPGALRSDFENYLTAHLSVLDDYYSNGMTPPADEPGPEDIFFSCGSARISPYVSGNSCVLFLPVMPDDSEFKVTLPDNMRLWLDGREIADKGSISCKELQAVRKLKAVHDGKDKEYSTEVMIARGMQSLFIDTASGKMDYILSDIDHKESGRCCLTDEKGRVSFEGEFKSLKGRGRSSWLNDLEKKSYNLNFSSPVGMAGMNETAKYALIANAYDGSFLRNHITGIMAKKSSLDYTPESSYVNLYLNGSYAGVYQLSHKNIVDKAGVDITDLDEANTEAAPDVEFKTAETEQWAGRQGVLTVVTPEDITGGYLIEGNLSKHPVTGFFNTDRDYRLELVSPEYPATQETQYIYEYFQAVENAVYSPEGRDPDTGKTIEELIDVDSFADKYLIDEISKNYDAVKYSAYYYKDHDPDVLHAGPVWDYDIAYGNANVDKDDINSPEGLTFLLMGDRFKDHIFSKLMEREDFRARVRKRFDEVFLPVIGELLNGEIDRQADKLRYGAAMDDRRYEAYKAETGKIFEVSVDKLKSFIKTRAEFLRGAL